MIKAQSTTMGTLYIVATPIGNRDDISLRAINILKSVDCILAEDTRHSLQLLSGLGIKNKLRSLHAHNESEKSILLINELMQGQSFALISDAGTPLISDPGYPLVKLARQHQIPVIPIPGPSALITALSAAGVPCDSFLYVGFLPAKQQARKNKLISLFSEPHTLVFYESTHRLMDCFDDLIEVFGAEHPAVLAKELTKAYERFIDGSLSDIKTWLLGDTARVKGEFVVIIPPRPKVPDNPSNEQWLTLLLKELPLKKAVSIVCQMTKANKNELYEHALKIKKRDDHSS